MNFYIIYKFWAYAVSKLCWFLSVCIGLTFIPHIVRRLTKRRVTIIYYHDPLSDDFNRHITYMKSRYNFITFDQFFYALSNKCWHNLPNNSLIITLDDGHKGNFDLLDICKKNNIKPMIYLCSQVVNTYRGFWSACIPVSINERLKSYESNDRKRFLKERYGFELEREQSKRSALSLNEIILMKQFFDFGSHTRFHEILTTCSDDLCDSEISISKKELEIMLGSSCIDFSYPNGDYSKREINKVLSAGYRTARTIDLGWNNQTTDALKLKGIPVQDNANIRSLAGQLTSIPQYLTRFLMTGSTLGKHKTKKIH